MRSPATGSAPFVTRRLGRLFEPFAAPATCECESTTLRAPCFRLRITPFAGKVVEFEDLPAALDEMGQRLTMGRTVVSV
jgi:hypothetical protein